MKESKMSLLMVLSQSSIIKHGVPQGSVLGPVLFLLYINDLHKCIKHSTTYHFADDTNLLNITPDYKTLQREINQDLHFPCEWLVANKISLNEDIIIIIIRLTCQFHLKWVAQLLCLF